MKKVCRTFALAMAGIFAAGFVACTEPAADGKIEVSVPSLEFIADGESKTVDITGNNWKATSGEEWIEIVPSEGKITVTVGQNEVTEPRSGSISVKNADDSKTITITQAAANPGTDTSIKLDPMELSFTAEGESKTVSVTSELEWTPTPSDNWIVVGQADGVLTVTVGANDTADIRTGSITVDNGENSKTITVEQAATPVDTSLEIDNDDLSFEAAGGSQTVNVTSEVAWTATSAQEWVGIETFDDYFTVTLGRSNDVPAVVPVPLEGSITVSNGTETKTVAIHQALGVVTVTLNKRSTSLKPAETETLVANVLPANASNKSVEWTSDDEAVAKVSQEGVVTGVANGEATITVTTIDGGFTESCKVVVSDAWEPGTVSFRTNNTWTVGDQTWSDVVLATGAEKDTFDGAEKADARQNGEYGHMFSWEAVNQFGEELCPEDWRVPTSTDFYNLDLALGGNGSNFQIAEAQKLKYIDQWGLEWGGVAFRNNLSGQGAHGNSYYWSSTENNAAAAIALGITDNNPPLTPNPKLAPNASQLKEYGCRVRCVK